MDGEVETSKVSIHTSTALGLPSGSYHYQLAGLRHGKAAGPASAGGFLTYASGPVAVISSDNLVRVFDPTRLAGGLSRLEADAGIIGKHADVTGICSLPGSAGLGVMTAGRDGLVRHWDPRISTAAAKPTWERPTKLQTAYLSLASCGLSHMWAAGTELTSSVAMVEVWDHRQMEQPISSYVECHSDDVSSLSFSLNHPSSLVSGSTDGLVNVYNPAFPSDEDEALLQVVNHGSSIHQAGFLGEANDTMLFALSHDEKFSVYRREDSKEDPNENVEMHDGGSEDGLPVAAFGDVRARFDCNYVAEILPCAGGFCVAAGSFDQQRFDLVGVPYAGLDQDPPAVGSITRCQGAHGEEVVRSALPYGTGADAALITAGEDGTIRFWPLAAGAGAGASGVGPSTTGEEGSRTHSSSGHKAKRRRSEKGEREGKHFKPY